MEYDFAHRFGIDVSSILTRQIPWARAWDLATQLLRDPDSHIFASVAGWSFVPGAAYRSALDLFELWANARRAPNTTQIRVPRPWTRAVPRPAPPRLPTAEERRQREKLQSILYRN